MKIEIRNTEISEEARALNRMKLKGSSDSHIKIVGTTITGKAKVLEDFEIDFALEKALTEMERSDLRDPEREALQALVRTRNEGREGVRKKFLEHLQTFTQGVLINIVSELLMS